MITIKDIAYIRLRAPDLDKMETFLTDFGMVRAARTDSALFMRGANTTTHHLHVTELGDTGFIGTGFIAESRADLEALAKLDGASDIHDTGEPGGGERVQLKDPDGNLVEVIHGMETPDPLPVSQAYTQNFGSARQRLGEFVRNESGPSQVRRLGHVLLLTPQLPAIADFYRKTLGMVSSDEVFDGDESNIVAAFNRLDHGDDYVDHHTIVPVAHPEKTGMQHAAFEVENIDAMMLGHDHLVSKGYKHSWGVGRHWLGSQIFDYWYDPFGNIVEHFIDGDLLNKQAKPGLTSIQEALGVQWGPMVPTEFL